MSTPELAAVVAGAGIAGLAAALELQQSSPEILVVDASDRPGGVMRTDHGSGFVGSEIGEQEAKIGGVDARQQALCTRVHARVQETPEDSCCDEGFRHTVQP